MGDASQATQVKTNKWLRPHAQRTAEAVGDWGQAEGSQYMGMSDNYRQSLLGMQQQSLQGQASQPFMDEYQKTLSGGYLDPENDPNFRGVVDRAVSHAGRGPMSQAAGSGRGRSGVFANALADAQMGTAGEMYSNQYNRERGNMGRMMQLAPQAEQMQYADAMRYQGVEAQLQQEGMNERDWELQKAGMMNQGLVGNPLAGASSTQMSTPFDYTGAAMGLLNPLAGMMGGG